MNDMSSQVDSNENDCFDYRQLAGNINAEELPENTDQRSRNHSTADLKSLGSASSGNMNRSKRSHRSNFKNSPGSDQ